VAADPGDTTCFPLFTTAATGDLGPKSGSSLLFNSVTSALSTPIIDASGTAGQLKFNGSDIGLKIDSGTTLQVKQTSGGAFGGLYSAGQVSGDGTYKEITGIAATANNTTTTPHGFNPAVPRLIQWALVCTAALGDGGYAQDDEVLMQYPVYTGTSQFMSIMVNDTNAVLVMSALGLYILDKSTRAIHSVDRTKWTITIRMWK
jgi:hypothetical protein